MAMVADVDVEAVEEAEVVGSQHPTLHLLVVAAGDAT